MADKPRTLTTAGEAGKTPVRKRLPPADPQSYQQAPSNQEFLDLLGSEEGNQLLQQLGVGSIPGVTLPQAGQGTMDDWLGTTSPESAKPEYRGGLVGPNGEPLPVGAVAFDSYGRPYYGPGLAGYWKGVKARLYGNPELGFLEGLLAGDLAEADPNAEITNIQDKYGTFGEWMQRGFVEGAGALESPKSVKDALGGLLTEATTGIQWFGDVWENLRAGQFEVATAPVKVVQEAVNVVMEGFQQIDYVLESAIFGTVTEYKHAKSTGRSDVEALGEALTAVTDPAARMAYTGLFNEAAYAELKREIAEGADPFLARLRWEDPLIEMGGQVITGLVSGVAWNKAMKFLGLGKYAGELKASTIVADDVLVKQLNKFRNAPKNAADELPELMRILRSRMEETTQAAQELASKRGWRTMTSGGKQQTHTEIFHDYVMYLLNETAKKGPDGKRVVDTEAVTEALTKMARAYDGTDESLKELIGFATTWTGGKNKAPELLLSPSGRKTGWMLNELLLGEGGKGESWIRKVIREADGDPEKLMKKLLPAMETKTKELFPSVLDVMKAEETRKAQMVAAGLEYTASKEFQAIPSYMKRFAQFDDVVGKGIYGPVNKFFATIYMGMSPGYALRNHFTNMLHVWVDHGPFAMIRREDDAIRLTENWLQFLPEAAEKGFAGPVGAVLSREMLSRQADDLTWLQRLTTVTSRWSQGFELKAARKVVAQAVDDSMKKSIKAIMRSDEVLNSLGPELTKRYGKELTAQLMQRFGRTDEVLDWFKTTAKQGYYESWKSIANIADEDIEMLRKFGIYNLEGKVVDALLNATDADNFVARMQNLKEDIRLMVNQTIFEPAVYSYDHGNSDDLAFIADAIAEGLLYDADGAIFSARDVSTSNAFNAAENAATELGARIRQYLAIEISKMGVTHEEAGAIIDKLWRPISSDIDQFRRTGNSKHQSLLNTVRMMTDAIRGEEGGQLTSPALINHLMSKGFEFPAEGAIGKYQAVEYLWDVYRQERKLAYGTSRVDAVNLVSEFFNNLPKTLQSEEVALGPLGQLMATAQAEGRTVVDLPALAQEIERMVGSDTLVRRMQEMETVASMWDDMTPQKLAAYGGAYAIYPHAENALEVFRRLNIPTASDTGAPFSIRTLQHYTQRGLDWMRGKDPDLAIQDFTVDELRSANKMAPDRLTELETVVRGWLEEKLEPLGVTINEWLKPGKAGEMLEGVETGFAQVARNEIRLARTGEELLDTVKRFTKGNVNWIADEAGDILPEGVLAQVIDPYDARYTGNGREWQIVVNPNVLGENVEDTRDLASILSRADEISAARLDVGDVATEAVESIAEVSLDTIRDIALKTPVGDSAVRYVMANLDQDQQISLIRAIGEAAGEAINPGSEAMHGKLLQEFLEDVLHRSPNEQTIRTVLGHEMGHMLERGFWGIDNFLDGKVVEGSDLEKLHSLFGGAMGPGDRRLTSEGAEKLTDLAIAMSRHEDNADVLKAVGSTFPDATEEHIQIIEKLISQPNTENLAGLVDALVNPSQLEGVAEVVGGVVGRGSHAGLAGTDIRIPQSAFKGGQLDWSQDLNAKNRFLDKMVSIANEARSGDYSMKGVLGVSTDDDAAEVFKRALKLMYGGDGARADLVFSDIMAKFNTYQLGDWQIWRAVRETFTTDQEAAAFVDALLKVVPTGARTRAMQEMTTLRGVFVAGKGWQWSDEWSHARILGRATNVAESKITDAGLTITRRPGQPFMIEGFEGFVGAAPLTQAELGQLPPGAMDELKALLKRFEGGMTPQQRANLARQQARVSEVGGVGIHVPPTGAIDNMFIMEVSEFMEKHDMDPDVLAKAISALQPSGTDIAAQVMEEFGMDASDYEGMGKALMELVMGEGAPFNIGTDAVQVRLPHDLQLTPSGDGYITALKMIMRKAFDDDPMAFQKWFRDFLADMAQVESDVPAWYMKRKLDTNTITNMLWGEMGRGPMGDPLSMPHSGTHTPSPSRFMAENKDGIYQLIDRITEGVQARFSSGAVTEFSATAEEVQQVEKWAETVEPMMSRARLAASEVGTSAREFTLLDYEKKKGYDAFFGYIFPYQFWYNRTYSNWIKHRMTTNAPLIGSYAAYRTGLEKIHAGMPDWWKYNINTNELFGLDWENPLYFNLEASLNPLNGLTGVDFDNPELQNHWVSRTLTDLAKFGPTVWTPFQLAAAAHLKWNKKDDQAAAALAGRLFPQTAAIRAAGALFGQDIELDPNVHIFSDGIEYYERRRIGRALAALAQQGQVTNAQAVEAAYSQEGPIWDQAKMMALQDRAPGQLAAFGAGVGFKGRREEEIVIDEYYKKRNVIISQRDSVRPDEYAQMWDQLRLEYPFMDTLILSKRPGEARDQALAYNTLGRIPPGQQDQWIEWSGIPQPLINKFYESKGKVGEWNESDRMRFMAGIVDLQAVLEVPPGTTLQQWNAAKNEYRLLNRQIEQRFGADIDLLVDGYFDIKNEGTRQQADEYLAMHPQVEQALDMRSQRILNHPTLKVYYGGIDTLERYYTGLMYDDARTLFGEDIFELQSTYFEIKEAGGNTRGFLYGRSEELGNHSRLMDYWDWNRAQKDLIARRIADFGVDMQPLQQAAIRYDVAEDTLGIQAVMSGIFEERLAQGLEDPELSALVRQYTTGTQREGDPLLPDVGRIPTADFYLNVPYEYISRFFSPTLRYRLDNHFTRGDPLSEDGIRELQEVWISLGRPSGNFSQWVNSYLQVQYTQGGNLAAGQVPAAIQ